MRRKVFRGMGCRQVGRSGLWVSEVGLGLWKWGDPSYDGSKVGEHEGFKILDRALELGVFFWDTANSYNWGSGNSERLIGRYFASRGRRVREQVVLATKIANSVREEHEEKADFTPNQRGASRLYIRRAVEGCLRRLQTDYIDLLYVHYPVLDEEGEYETPLEETWGTLDDLISDGVVYYLGVSNYNIRQIEEAREALRKVAKDASRRIVAVQNPYNLLERDAVSKEEGVGEAEFLRYIREAGIGLVPYFPLAAGMLTGKYRKDNIDRVKGHIIDDKLQDRYFTEANFRAVELLQEFAKRKGVTLPQLAIAWLLSHEEVCGVIAGVTKMEHLEDNAKATSIELTEEDLREIDEILERAGVR